MGGISGGIEAVLLGRDFFSGAGPIHTMPVEGNLFAVSTPALYSDEYLYQLKNANYKGVGPGGGMTIDIDPKHATMDADGVLTIKSTGDQALAATVPTIWRRGMSSKIMFGKAAFSSKEQLVVAMAHELGHVVLNNNPSLMRMADELTGSNDPLLNTAGHEAIQSTTYDLIRENNWNFNLFRSQVTDFRFVSPYEQLLAPIRRFSKPILFP